MDFDKELRGIKLLTNVLADIKRTCEDSSNDLDYDNELFPARIEKEEGLSVEMCNCIVEAESALMECKRMRR